MLIEFRVKNFKSFRDECVFSMVAGNDNSLPENTFKAGKHTLLKTAAIYGANASGKSNLLKAVEFMRDLVLNSAQSKPLDEIDTIRFLLDKDSKNEPSEFTIVFIHEKKQYEYGFSVDTKQIHEEWMFVTEPPTSAKPSPRPQNWFSRKWNKKTKKYIWKFSSYLLGAKKNLQQETRENCLFLSKAADNNLPQILKVYEWFKIFLRVHKQKDLAPDMTAHFLNTCDQEFRNLFIQFFQQADLGISSIFTEKRKISESEMKLSDYFTIKGQEAFLKNLEERPQYDIKFEHNSSEGTAILPLESESEGTQRLFALYAPLLTAFFYDYTVFLDELESSLHPELAQHILKMFYSGFPKSQAQLIFTTHDTTLLDNELFRRDQIWFTQKLKNGSTDLYSLLEHKARKDEAWQKGYLGGRYGAVPILERFES